MKKITLIIIAFFIVPSVFAEGIQTFSFGGGVGLSTLYRGPTPRFTIEPGYGVKFETHIGGKWQLEFSLSKFKIHNDSTASSEFQFGSDENNRTKTWKGYDLTLVFGYRLLPYDKNFSLISGVGGGLSVWKMVDAKADTVLKVTGERNSDVDFAATEIFLTAAAGAEYRFEEHVKLGLNLSANYLTGIGLEFAPDVENNRSRWNLKAGLFLSYFFFKKEWASKLVGEEFVLSDRLINNSVISPKIEPAKIEMFEKSDSDRDGIPDIADDCLNTPAEAKGFVDIRGCPIDTDCDGIADYQDKCPHNPKGARIDDMGCPLDSDNDGVPDGLDDCPNSEPDLAVDQVGCIDLSMLEKPMILNIKYHSGSFEIDRKTKEKLNELYRILSKAPGVRVEIAGYTDNIGTSEANRILSGKRARRVRDYLVSLGIDTSRLMPIGKGETNFIKSNATREGRQKNRRVELIFFK